MTIAISVKVHDGIVLAADSASTLIVPDQSGSPRVSNVYNNANKIFNLFKGLPIGGITCGAGSIGQASISTLAKDLRKRFMGKDEAHKDWMLDKDSYTIEKVARKTREFLYDEHYLPLYEGVPQKPSLSFYVAGYSSKEDLSEFWHINISESGCPEPQLLRPKEESGINWDGEPEAVTRLILGHGTGLPRAFSDLGVPDEQIVQVVKQIRTALYVPLHTAPMPIQDAIDLAAFLGYTTIMFSRFTSGPPTVGGPIEVAAITKHEGFKWIERKHYFDVKLNTKEV